MEQNSSSLIRPPRIPQPCSREHNVHIHAPDGYGMNGMMGGMGGMYGGGMGMGGMGMGNMGMGGMGLGGMYPGGMYPGGMMGGGMYGGGMMGPYGGGVSLPSLALLSFPTSPHRCSKPSSVVCTDLRYLLICVRGGLGLVWLTMY